jgi:ethanolamine ammonia-lyase small subunit
LRQDRAAAQDAVHVELDLERDLGRELLNYWALFEVGTRASTKAEYLLRPDLGRSLDDDASVEIARQCPAGADLQVAVGDGLSPKAVIAQVPTLLPLLAEECARLGWRFGRPFFVRHCRVGVLNDIGAQLDPVVCVLLIGERPGLATIEALSAYMAFHPRPGDTDARRNLISNIHALGLSAEQATRRIIELAERMRKLGASGSAVKESAGTI